MADYHLYCIGADNKIVSRHDLTVADDLAALEEGRRLCGEYEVEIWQGKRLVTRVAKDGSASKVRPTGPPA